ncbi:GGDEF domain-containing protein [Thalassotalea montiporae]
MILFKILAFISLFTVSTVWGKTPEINALLAQAENVRQENPKKFNETINLLESKALSFSHEQRMNYYVLKAYKLTIMGNYAEAEQLLDTVSKNSSNNELILRATYGLISVYLAKKDWTNGFLFVEKTLQQIKQVNNSPHTIYGLLTVIVFYNQIQQFELSLSYIKTLNTEQLTLKNKCFVEQLRLEASQNKNFSSVIQIFQMEETIKTCEEANWPVAASVVRAYLAKNHLESGSPQEAILSLTPFINDVLATKFSLAIIDFYNTLAKAYYQLGKAEKSSHYADLAIENITHSNTKQTVDAYHQKYQLEYDAQNFETALDYYIKYAEADKAYLNDITARNVAFQLAQHQAIQQKNQIELLNNQNELLNNKNELLRVEQSLARTEAENTKLIASLLMAIIALLAFFGYRSWRTQRRLKTLAEFDYLTKVYNRGHFMTLAEETLKLATKAKQTVTCIIFDLDKFKKINDQYGHSAGDLALKAAASAAHSCVRDNDIFARLGGEEFVILLPGCDTSAACYVAEKCMRAFEAIDTSDSGHDFSVTASFGITTSKISGMAIDDLIADADKALYQAKNNGRNQYRIYEP